MRAGAAATTAAAHRLRGAADASGYLRDCQFFHSVPLGPQAHSHGYEP